MRIVVISMANRLLSGAMIKYLRERGELMPLRVIDDKGAEEPYATCMAHDASHLLMEVTKVSPFTLKERLATAREVRASLPRCKIALLCDDLADPDTAEQIKEAKKHDLVDGFFYSSVSGEYLAASLDAM